MEQRRETDPQVQDLKHAVAILQHDIEPLADLPTALAKLNTSIEVLNTTFKILGVVFSIMFPVLCGWNYYLGNGVTGLENTAAKHSIQIQQLESQSAKAEQSINTLRDKQH